MMYVDFDDYTTIYYGTLVAADEFPRLSSMASTYIGMICQGRIKDEIIDEVKLATCAVIDVIYKDEKEPEVSSLSIGRKSVSYVATGKTINDKKYGAAYPFLIHSGLLYGGVYV